MVQAMEPTPDERLFARAAAEELRDKLEEIVSSLRCEFSQGVLVLRGRTNSFYHKQLAQETARCLGGVIRVVNRIEVAAAPREGRAGQGELVARG